MTGLFSRDVQVRSMEQSVSQTEKLLGQLCLVLAAYTRKTAGLRDKGDQLVGQLLDLSRSEDPELQLGLKNLADDLAMVQDYRQAQVERMESRVVAPLKAYGDIVKSKRTELKKFNADRTRELKEIQKLEKIRLKNPVDRQSISQAEVSAQKASHNAQRSTRLMEEAILDFQKNKLEDIKTIFTDFVTVEMLFHAKALEIYTHAFHNLEAMDLHRDLELFGGRVRAPDFLSSHVDSPVSGRSLQSPNTRGPFREHQWPHTNPIPRPRSTLRKQRNMEEEPHNEEEEEEGQESDTDATPTRRSYTPQYAQVRRWNN
ncbi:CBY1-interacting BAR domain-containing protein 2-like [Eucyclogobius newberryi]|uniref:CBY1-interacting BAR domain-containing protein 2-like n=1 Tax=Eucyclogobius newberryi TaxID=166745 RepID=UPI003B5945D9